MRLAAYAHCRVCGVTYPRASQALPPHEESEQTSGIPTVPGGSERRAGEQYTHTNGRCPQGGEVASTHPPTRKLMKEYSSDQNAIQVVIKDLLSFLCSMRTRH